MLVNWSAWAGKFYISLEYHDVKYIMYAKNGYEIIQQWYANYDLKKNVAESACWVLRTRQDKGHNDKHENYVIKTWAK